MKSVRTHLDKGWAGYTRHNPSFEPDRVQLLARKFEIRPSLFVCMKLTFICQANCTKTFQSFYLFFTGRDRRLFKGDTIFFDGEGGC